MARPAPGRGGRGSAGRRGAHFRVTAFHVAGCVDVGFVRLREAVRRQRQVRGLQRDRSAIHGYSGRRHGVSVEHVRVIVIIGTAVATQVGDSDDEGIRAEYLCVESAHAESE